MKRTMLTVVLAAAVMVIGMTAQAPPNLSGTWRPQNPNSGQVNPFEFTITQTADNVTIRTPLNTPESVTLKVNGEETRTAVGGGQGGANAATVTSRATWEGSKLVVTSAVSGGRGGPSSSKQTFSLTSDTLTHHGRFYDFDNVPLEMTPRQRPHPPFWYASKTPDDAASEGLNYVTHPGARLRFSDRVAARVTGLYQRVGRRPQGKPRSDGVL